MPGRSWEPLFGPPGKTGQPGDHHQNRHAFRRQDADWPYGKGEKYDQTLAKGCRHNDLFSMQAGGPVGFRLLFSQDHGFLDDG